MNTFVAAAVASVAATCVCRRVGVLSTLYVVSKECFKILGKQRRGVIGYTPFGARGGDHSVTSYTRFT